MLGQYSVESYKVRWYKYFSCIVLFTLETFLERLLHVPHVIWLPPSIAVHYKSGRGLHTFVTHSYLTGTHGRYVRLETEDDATRH